MAKKYQLTAMNVRREDWAKQALTTFAGATRQDMNLELEDVVGDLLADLRHFCHQHKLDFDALSRTGEMHFEAEAKGDE